MGNQWRKPGASLAGWGAGIILGTVAMLGPAHAAPEARVEFFSPQGYTRQVRQAVVRFTLSMVALGDARLPDPFTVDCPAKGQGRWAVDAALSRLVQK